MVWEEGATKSKKWKKEKFGKPAVKITDRNKKRTPQQ